MGCFSLLLPLALLSLSLSLFSLSLMEGQAHGDGTLAQAGEPIGVVALWLLSVTGGNFR